MLPEMATRLLISGIVIASGLGLYWLTNRILLKRAGIRVHDLATFRPGSPAILYFTTPTCVPCKTVQRPAIESLKTRLGDGLQVVEIDASARPDLADEWGILSVPTTFVIDASGQPRHINHGVTTTEKLFQQLKEIL